VLLVSEDLEELLALCDRVVVMFEGRIVGRGAGRAGDPRGARAADGGRGGVIALVLRGREPRWLAAALVLLAVALTYALTAVPIRLAGANPTAAYQRYLLRPLLSPTSFGEVLLASTPLLFTGLAVALAFRTGFYNIGAKASSWRARSARRGWRPGGCRALPLWWRCRCCFWRVRWPAHYGS
jgi:hypothetical protein